MPARDTREIMLSLDDSLGEPLYRQIYEQVRNAIVQGALVEGDRLPSIRKLSANQGISHTTVEQAYLQLATEGYVRNVPRSGYRVEHLDTAFLRREKPDAAAGVERAKRSRVADSFNAENRQGGRVRYDFSYANLQPDTFPVSTWRKLANDVLYARTAPALARYSYTDEASALSRALARYLGYSRGVSCMPEQVIVQAGTDGALSTILQLFNPEEHTIGMEEPGYATVHEVAHRLGFRMVPLPSDETADAFLEAVRRQNPKIVYCTPSHQFPTGKVLGLEARTELLKWAQERNAYIIEDDACNEFRYDTAPIPSLQSLDAENRVIYLCGFSKMLSPALRVAYLVLPPKLLGRYWRLCNAAHPAVSSIEQDVLARFVAEGYLDQQVRRVTVGNKRRHDALLSALREAFGDEVRIQGAQSGMHLYVKMQNDMGQDELIACAREQGVAVYGTRRMWFSRALPDNALMVGFSAIDLNDIPPGVEALARAWS